MRIRSVLALLAVFVLQACGVGGLFRTYEYEEEMYLSLDGTAIVYVNSSVAALNALRGAQFDVDPERAPDRETLRRYFSSANAQVSRVTLSRRSNRRFVHIRIDVADVSKLNEAPPFAWSTYSFKRDGDLFYYKQIVGAPTAGVNASQASWKGNELVAFRIHLPSKIAYHNAGAGNPQRGNILSWEQPLSERLRGTPLTLDARIETQSILYRTLALFGATLVAVAMLFGLLLWWVLRRGAKPAHV